MTIKNAIICYVNIALLSFEYPPETGYGGIGTYTWYQARALVKLGHRVHVLAGANAPTSMQKSEHDGVTVYRFQSNHFAIRTFQHLSKLRMWWSKNRLETAVSMYQAFRELDAAHRYDAVEMPECGAEGLFVNRIAGIPAIIKLHSPARLIMPFYDVRRADIALCSFLEQRAISRARHYSSCSHFLADQATEKLDVKKPIRVIPNGIDIELFDRSERVDLRKDLGIPADRIVILFSGRMENRKGIFLCKDIVTTILEKYEVSFVFAGQDLFHYLRDDLLPYWKGRNLRGSVHYAGRLGQASVRSLLHQADIFLLPSLWENCPYSCLEAMAAGCAVVSSDQGGMPEIIQHGINGFLAPSGSVASYVERLEMLIEDCALRKKFGAEARKTIEQSFNDIRIAEMSVEYYRESCGVEQQAALQVL